ncbi:MAG TPA: PqqD family protein [Candidatus Acidoferrales bacterium]|nr:PqqD family protein [Candidatus Acidoferrales bacterium]
MNCPYKPADLDIRTVGEEVLVHDPSHEKVHILNRSAGQILELCTGDHTQEDIVTSICAQTGADQETVARDVAALLSEFSKLGLVTTA